MPPPPSRPPLQPGVTYAILIRNLWRLLHAGWPMAEARDAVLADAGLRVFPPRPANYNSSSRRPRRPPDPTIH